MNPEPQNGEFSDEQPNPEEEKAKPSVKERILSILSGFFFGIAVVVFLIIIYANTAKNLTLPPLLSPILFLLFGEGVGLGMLFRTFKNEKENVSPINFFFKIAASVLIILTVLISFLVSITEILL